MVDLAMIQVVLLSGLWMVYLARRFSVEDAVSFFVLNGIFPGICDSIIYFCLRTYEYPGRGWQWVICYITFGWMSVAATCLFLAEGIVTRGTAKLLATPSWRIPLLAACIGLTFDLLLDPVADAVRLWTWSFRGGSPFHGVPMTNFLAWFLLLFKGTWLWMNLLRRPPPQRLALSLKWLIPSVLLFWPVMTILGLLCGDVLIWR